MSTEPRGCGRQAAQHLLCTGHGGPDESDVVPVLREKTDLGQYSTTDTMTEDPNPTQGSWRGGKAGGPPSRRPVFELYVLR